MWGTVVSVSTRTFKTKEGEKMSSYNDGRGVSNQTAGDGVHDIADDLGGKSTLISRNITVLGRRTSVRLEPEMWGALREIARREDCKIHDICSLIHLRKNQDTSLTAAIRVFLMLYYRAAATEDGHGRAGHGDFSHMIQRARMPAELMSWKRSHRRASATSNTPMATSAPGMAMGQML